jgi:hypothetical protein
MDSKRILIAGVLLLFFSLIFGCSSIQSSDSRDVVLIGEVVRSKGCFAVDGVIDCSEKGLSSVNEGMVVEIRGVVGKYPCSNNGEQCYLGDAFKEVSLVKVLDFNLVKENYSKVDYSKDNPYYAFNQQYTGPTVCNRTLVSFGDLNFGNVDLNSIFAADATGGKIIHFDMLPSPCYCGKVSNLTLDVFVPSDFEAGGVLHSKLLKSIETGDSFQGFCAN